MVCQRPDRKTLDLIVSKARAEDERIVAGSAIHYVIAG
jgi:hypothetical protein